MAFNFSTQFLVQPRRSGQRRSLAAAVNRQLRGECESPPPSSVYRHQPRNDPLRTLMSRVASKLEEGKFKGAVRTLCSEDSIADIDSAKTISALQKKHPPMLLDAHIPDLIEDASLSTPISEDDVFHAIRSFPRGSAGGPDRIRP